ncbi:MAG: GTP-binding protein EngB [Halobacteria archaeon]|nr:GTP-binding protein EngB [Halobacteria archaeon]
MITARGPESSGRSNVGKTSMMREVVGRGYETGKRPGVTLEPNQYDWSAESFAVTDMPGFGFMSGVDEERQEEVRDSIVEYLEKHSDRILVAVHVIDANSFVDIVDRWEERDEVPHDVDLHGLLHDLEIPTVVAVNKIDKVEDRDERLDAVVDRLGYPPPWKQWDDVFAPVNAKQGNVEPLFSVVRDELERQNRHDLLKFFS